MVALLRRFVAAPCAIEALAPWPKESALPMRPETESGAAPAPAATVIGALPSTTRCTTKGVAMLPVAGWCTSPCTTSV